MLADLFHPVVARWFEHSFAAATACQQRAWPAIQSRHHTLIAAPTGSGKTLAAFLCAIDGLLREVSLDKANGFTGKTVIHPSHLRYVNAMQAVTREEYEDASQILDTTGGVIKSAKSNKMNEINPHRSWARRITSLADAYGVVEDESKVLALFRAVETHSQAAE